MMVMVAQKVPVSFRGLAGDTAVAPDMVPVLQRLDALHRRALELRSRPFMGAATKAHLTRTVANMVALEGTYSQPPDAQVTHVTAQEATAVLDTIERGLNEIDKASKRTLVLASVGIAAGFVAAGAYVRKRSQKGSR